MQFLVTAGVLSFQQSIFCEDILLLLGDGAKDLCYALAFTDLVGIDTEPDGYFYDTEEGGPLTKESLLARGRTVEVIKALPRETIAGLGYEAFLRELSVCRRKRNQLAVFPVEKSETSVICFEEGYFVGFDMVQQLVFTQDIKLAQRYLPHVADPLCIYFGQAYGKEACRQQFLEKAV